MNLDGKVLKRLQKVHKMLMALRFPFDSVDCGSKRAPKEHEVLAVISAGESRVNLIKWLLLRQVLLYQQLKGSTRSASSRSSLTPTTPARMKP